jgi:hypothetical protein
LAAGRLFLRWAVWFVVRVLILFRVVCHEVGVLS